MCSNERLARAGFGSYSVSTEVIITGTDIPAPSPVRSGLGLLVRGGGLEGNLIKADALDSVTLG